MCMWLDGTRTNVHHVHVVHTPLESHARASDKCTSVCTAI